MLMMDLSSAPRTLHSTTPEPTELTQAIYEVEQRNNRIGNTPYCSAEIINPPITTQPVTVRINENGAILASVPAGNIPSNHTAASTVKALTMFRVFQQVLGGQLENLNNPVPQQVMKAANDLESTFFQNGDPKTWGDLIKYTWETSDNGLSEILAAYTNENLPNSLKEMAPKPATIPFQ